MSGSMNPRFVPDGHGHAELVILVSLFRQRIPICIPPYCVLIYDMFMPQPSRFERPCLFNTTIDGADAYASSDLLAPHPTKPGYWKVHGRVDDQIMHSTGEKVRRNQPHWISFMTD